MSFGMRTGLGRAVVKWLHGTTLVGLVAAGVLAGCDGQPSTSATRQVGFPWQAVDAELEHACALAEGVTYCWGDIPTVPGQSDVPVEFKDVPHFVDVGVGVNFSCGLTDKGQVYCWGSNSVGQLGRAQGAGTTPLDWEPDLIDSNRTFEQISVGYAYACGISEGEAYCWGRNNYGQLGNGQFAAAGSGVTYLIEHAPVEVGPGHKATDIEVGLFFACAAHVRRIPLPSGSAAPKPLVTCWGKNDKGQLGQTSSKEDCRSGNPCTPLPDSLPIVAQPRPMTSDQRPAGQRVFHPTLSVGRNMGCALVQTSTGIQFDPNATHYCWGSGPLGDGSGQDSATPVLVATP